MLLLLLLVWLFKLLLLLFHLSTRENLLDPCKTNPTLLIKHLRGLIAMEVNAPTMVALIRAFGAGPTMTGLVSQGSTSFLEFVVVMYKLTLVPKGAGTCVSEFRAEFGFVEVCVAATTVLVTAAVVVVVVNSRGCGDCRERRRGRGRGRGSGKVVLMIVILRAIPAGQAVVSVKTPVVMVVVFVIVWVVVVGLVKVFGGACVCVS